MEFEEEFLLLLLLVEISAALGLQCDFCCMLLRSKKLHFTNWLNQNCESLVWVGDFVSGLV